MSRIVSKIKHMIVDTEIKFPSVRKTVFVSSVITASVVVFGVYTTIVQMNKSRTQLNNSKNSLSQNSENTLGSGTNLVPSLSDVYKRNIFNLDGIIPDSESATGEPICPLEPLKSSFSYKISGIVYGGSSEGSLVIFESSGPQGGIFKVGEKLPQGGSVYAIEKDRVLILNKQCPEYISLNYPSPKSAREMKTKTSSVTYKENGFERVGNDTTVTKQWLGNVLTNNFNETLEAARAVPNMVGGQVKGFSITEIDPGSVYDKLGIRNGDVVSSINGVDLNDAARAIQTLNSMRNESAIELQVLRGGQPVTLKVNVQ